MESLSSVWQFFFLSYNLERCKSTQWEFDVKWCTENNKLQAAAGKADWSSDWLTDCWIGHTMLPLPSLWFEVGIIFLMLQPLDCNFFGYPSTNKWITWIKRPMILLFLLKNIKFESKVVRFSVPARLVIMYIVHLCRERERERAIFARKVGNVGLVYFSSSLLWWVSGVWFFFGCSHTGDQPQEEISQIWLQVREQSRKMFKNLAIFRWPAIELIVQIWQFQKTNPQNLVIWNYFFQQKSGFFLGGLPSDKN